MTIHRSFQGAALVAFGLISAGPLAGAQAVHRDTKVTGPRGRTVERQIDVRRTPGSIERDVRITRPGGTIERETQVSRAGGLGPARGPLGPHFGGGPGPRNVIIERNYYGGPPIPRGGGGPGFNLFLGGFLPPPPPVVIVPEPIFVAPIPPPTVVVQPPVRYAAPIAPETVVVDPVAEGVERLRSFHANSRRDGALALGRLGDARAVLPLAERLEKDWDKDVRVAAAWALGEIGDPRGGVALQRAELYDKKQDVQNVAAKAIRKLNRPRIEETPQFIPEGEPQFDPTSASSLAPPPFEGPRNLDPPPPPQPLPPPDLPR